MSSTPAPGSADPRGRAIEVLAVLLLGVATLGSAWCGYQASQWNGLQNERANDSSDGRVEAGRLFSLATQEITYDSVIVAQYAEAAASGDQRLQDFYRQTLIRPEFQPFLDRWSAQIRAGEPATRLLEDAEYFRQRFDRYTAAQDAAEAADQESRVAAQNADDYVLLTVLFASAMLFAGITTSFRARPARLLLIAGAGIILAYCLAQVADLPVA